MTGVSHLPWSSGIRSGREILEKARGGDPATTFFRRKHFPKRFPYGLEEIGEFYANIRTCALTLARNLPLFERGIRAAAAVIPVLYSHMLSALLHSRAPLYSRALLNSRACNGLRFRCCSACAVQRDVVVLCSCTCCTAMYGSYVHLLQ